MKHSVFIFGKKQWFRKIILEQRNRRHPAIVFDLIPVAHKLPAFSKNLFPRFFKPFSLFVKGSVEGGGVGDVGMDGGESHGNQFLAFGGRFRYQARIMNLI